MPDNSNLDLGDFDDMTPPPLIEATGSIPGTTGWIYSHFKILAMLATLVISPVCVHVGTGRVEKLRIKFDNAQRAKDREASIAIHTQKMRTVLVKEIISISKNASLNEVAHAYRMGLIAVIVMSNPKIFGLDMGTAKIKLDQIISKLKPVADIRKQLMSAEKQVQSLRGKMDGANSNKKRLVRSLYKARRNYKKYKWRGLAAQEKYAKAVAKVETELAKYSTKANLYEGLLRREQKRQQLYERQLKATSVELNRKIQEAATSKIESMKRILQLSSLLQQVSGKTKKQREQVATLKRLVDKITQANKAAQDTIQDLKTENDKLKAANKVLATEVKALLTKLPKPPMASGMEAGR